LVGAKPGESGSRQVGTHFAFERTGRRVQEGEVEIMACGWWAFDSGPKSSVSLSSLPVGAHAIVSSVLTGVSPPLIEQVLSLGVTPGAFVTMMQRFPSVVFLCGQTELAVERMVADVILVRPLEDWHDPALPEIRH